MLLHVCQIEKMLTSSSGPMMPENQLCYSRVCLQQYSNEMANNHADIVAQFLLADDDIEIVVLAFCYWRSINSHLNLWLLRKRLTLHRIFEDMRSGVVNYLIDVIPMYHNVQFHEHFRMSRSTFEVRNIIKFN